MQTVITKDHMELHVSEQIKIHIFSCEELNTVITVVNDERNSVIEVLCLTLVCLNVRLRIYIYAKGGKQSS